MAGLTYKLSRWDKIIVDTNCLMKRDARWDAFTAELRAAGTKVIIPTCVTREIDKLLASKTVEKRANAERADRIVSKIIADGVGEIVDLNEGRGTQNNIADEEIHSYVILFRRRHNFLVLTEDRDFATQLLGPGVAKTTRYLDVATLKNDGNLEFWEDAQCDYCNKITAARESVCAGQQLILCRECIKIERESDIETNIINPTSFSPTGNEANFDPKSTESRDTLASISDGEIEEEPDHPDTVTISFTPGSKVVTVVKRKNAPYFDVLTGKFMSTGELAAAILDEWGL